MTKISKQHLDDLIEANGYIPDHLLEEYLSDKLTVKPDYGFETREASDFERLFSEMRARIKKKDAKKKEDKKKSTFW